MNVLVRCLAVAIVPAFWLATSVSALGCVVSKPKKLDFLRDAEMVIRAKVVGYEWEPLQSRFTLVPVEIIKGPRKIVDLMTVRWINSTFGTPRQWEGSTDVIVGLDAVFDEQGRPIAEIAQQSCGPQSIYPDSPELRCQIVNIIYAHAPMFHCPKPTSMAE